MHETLPEICCPPRSSRFLCLFSDFFLILGTDGFLGHWKQLSPMGKSKLVVPWLKVLKADSLKWTGLAPESLFYLSPCHVHSVFFLCPLSKS